MRRANGTGSIVYLGKKRRRPYAIRISTDVHKIMTDKGLRYRQTYKYLAYFATAREAQAYLENLNTGKPVPAPQNVSKAPTFKDVYERWMEQKQALKRPPTEQTVKAYKTAFNRFSSIHGMRFDMIRHDDLQEIFTDSNSKSHSTVNHMHIILRAMYKYAMANEIVQKDYSAALIIDHEDKEQRAHKPFTSAEIKKLWSLDDDIAKVALILIYTGMRISEWTTMQCKDVFIDKQYMIGGVKTAAGKRRVIPIHKDIVPLVEYFMQKTTSKYIFPNKVGKVFDPSAIYAMWSPVIPNHMTHDCRHTCASKMEKAGVPLLHRKLILGHHVADLTEGRYTHVDPDVLVEDMNGVVFC